MRIYFKSMARPKRVARTLQDIFPLEKLSQCQAWTAKIYGYRDWHDLEQITREGHHDPSPDDEDLSKEDERRRSDRLMCVADEVLRIGLADSLLVYPRLNLTSRKPVPSARRVTKAPKGRNRFYQMLQTDLFDEGERGGNASVDEEFSAYATLPEHFGAESEARAKLVSLLKRKAKPYTGFAADCERMLMRPCPEQTELFWETSEDGETTWIIQCEQQRFYLFDRERKPVGFLELSQTLQADKDREDSNSLEMRIHEAWAIKDARWLLADIAATHFSGTLAKIGIAWRSNEPIPVNLELISDSEHLLMEDFLKDVAAHAAENLEITPSNIDVHYDD